MEGRERELEHRARNLADEIGTAREVNMGLMMERDALQARCASLEGALRFYAEGEWADGYPGGVYADEEHTTLDFGDTARAALSDTREEK